MTSARRFSYSAGVIRLIASRVSPGAEPAPAPTSADGRPAFVKSEGWEALNALTVSGETFDVAVVGHLEAVELAGHRGQVELGWVDALRRERRLDLGAADPRVVARLRLSGGGLLRGVDRLLVVGLRRALERLEALLELVALALRGLGAIALGPDCALARVSEPLVARRGRCRRRRGGGVPGGCRVGLGRRRASRGGHRARVGFLAHESRGVLLGGQWDVRCARGGRAPLSRVSRGRAGARASRRSPGTSSRRRRRGRASRSSDRAG
jgi:hypothetical protein